MHKTRIYLCGPTLYSQIHIGNARSLVLFDVIAEYYRRTSGVVYIRNITDVDDKIVAQSKDQHPGDWVTKNTLPQFIKDQKSLGLKLPDIEPRASQYIPQMIKLIQSMSTGLIYADDGVYFDPSVIPSYAIHLKRDTNTPFVVWKYVNDGTFTWQSPWGPGRPGWHTECAAMIGADGVDIHGGGIDLKFPHHENENVQCECAFNHPITKTWLHVGTVNVNNQKMAKSVGNVMTVEDLSNDWGADTLRTVLLMSAWSKPININLHRLQEAEKTVVKRPESAWNVDAEWDEYQMNLLKNNFTTRIV